MNSDVIVIGLGAMGSAACYQLAKRGVSVTGIDQFSPPHKYGSTHGETRVTRQAIGEGEQFVPLALRSYEIWRELEADTGADLLTVTGGLIMSGAKGEHALHGNAGFVETTINAARKFGIKHRVLNAQEIADEFPQFNLDGNETGYFEYEAGFLRPENCVKTQMQMAVSLGAKLCLNEKVLSVRQEGNSVKVATDKGVYSAAKVIISAGPWVNELVAGLPMDTFKIYRQVLHWFDISEAYQNYALGSFPIFIWEFGRWKDDFVYGFPAIDGAAGGLKIATEIFDKTALPDEVERSVSQHESARVFESYVKDRMNGIGLKCLKSAVCLYTMTNDSNFVIDHLDENILLASPCSGHGFKHSAAIGEILAELAIEGKSKIDISSFSLKRSA
jgi:sarcosine oxidase